jgi:hypothetical protein
VKPPPVVPAPQYQVGEIVYWIPPKFDTRHNVNPHTMWEVVGHEYPAVPFHYLRYFAGPDSGDAPFDPDLTKTVLQSSLQAVPPLVVLAVASLG